ncbi:uncharacterized protein LOC129291192 [Prosopis cineraria]|uniref:uncharacterized protein LOC129291192 n=1 Tax=Prosopis cineraria TaxID=364024 RepID=UPI0024105863|nr:uncharacterized protein LOC129291192 [Prosopis cineraria]
MEWKKYYLDAILVPLGFVITICYYVWLWRKVRTQPLRTTFGINSHIRRFWVPFILKDLEKKNVVAAQSLRNQLIGCTVMATTSILLAAGLAAVISTTYNAKKPLNDAVYGAEYNEFVVSLKYVTVLTIFIFSFVCYSLSIRLLNQVGILICAPRDDVVVASTVTPNYLTDLLEKGSTLNIVGNRLFFSALPLLLWIFGPILVFLCDVAVLPVLYHFDVVGESYDGKGKMEMITEMKHELV